MGLDIYLYKAQEGNDNNSFRKYTLDTNDLERVRNSKLAPYLYKTENEYYDFDKINITNELYDCQGWMIGEEGQIFHFINKKHELYPLYKKYNKANNIDIWTEKEKALLTKYGWDGDNNTVYETFQKNIQLNINGKDIPTRVEKEMAICGKEIGYQRKGLNGDFYKEWDPDEDYLVIDKARIQHVYDNYIDDNETKEYFKSQILDQFVEGETFAIFSW